MASRALTQVPAGLSGGVNKNPAVAAQELKFNSFTIIYSYHDEITSPLYHSYLRRDGYR